MAHLPTLLACILAAGLGGPALTEESLVYRTEITLNAPLETVWQAITEKALVDRYYLAPLLADVTGLGDAVAYGAPGAPMIDGSVTLWDPPNRLVHGFAFVEDGAPGPASEVTYALVPDGEGTRLTLEHRGYAEGTQPHADIAMGWPIILEGLKATLDGD